MTAYKALRLAYGIAICVLLFVVAPIAVPTACNIVRGGDATRELDVAWRTVRLLGMMLVGGTILAAIVGAWKITWKLAERPDSLWKKVAITVAFVAPVMLIVRSYEIDSDLLISRLHSWMRYLFGALIDILSYRVARDSEMRPLHKYLAAYTTIVVLMWLAEAGVFHGGDDESGYDDRIYVAPSGPLLIESAEQLLSNILVYSAGAFIGIAVAERLKRRRAIPDAGA